MPIKVLLLTALSLLSFPLRAEVVIEQTDTYIDVIGSPDGKLKYLLKFRDFVQHGNGEGAHSVTVNSFEWNYSFSKKGKLDCRVAKSRVKLIIKAVYPKFIGLNDEQSALATTYLEQLKSHELIHQDHAKRVAEAIDNMILNSQSEQGCDALAEAINEQIQNVTSNLSDLTETLDTATDNGKKIAQINPMVSVPDLSPIILTAQPALASTQTVVAKPVDKDGWFAIELKNGHITFPLELNGQAATAMIDSGAELNALSDYFIEQHRDQLTTGDRIRLKSVFGTEEKFMVNGLHVKWFGQPFILNNLTPAVLGGTDLLLGLAFLKNFIVQIDYPKKRMRLLPRDAIDLDKIANIKLRREKDSTLPTVSIEAEPGSPIWLTLDTGNSGGLFVRRSVAENYGWLDKYTRESHSTLGAGGVGQTESFRIPYCKIGPFELENVLVTVPAENQRSSIGDASDTLFSRGPNSKGLLGYDVLQWFVITVDFKEMKMHISAD